MLKISDNRFAGRSGEEWLELRALVFAYSVFFAKFKFLSSTELLISFRIIVFHFFSQHDWRSKALRSLIATAET